MLHDEIDGFRAFYGLSPLFNDAGSAQAIGAAKATNAFKAPYTATAVVVQHVSLQANDPLVHYLASDLNWPGANRYDRMPADLVSENLGLLNQRYQPWGGNPFYVGSDPNTYNLAIKDPLVEKSDDWDFPTDETLASDWLGRVHRGTPWQTIFLKATNILAFVQSGQEQTDGLVTWMDWTGDSDTTDAIAMAPVQDWHLASLLASMLNTNDFRILFSVNNLDPNAWLVLFDGLTALTNNLPDIDLNPIFEAPPQFASLVISSNSPQASTLASSIEAARAGQPDGFFRDVGDILAIPQLTGQSPFLNWNDNVQQQNGISDEAYEMIPSQLLPVLRADSIGSIMPASGQAIVQFTGYDDHAYEVQVSSDLMNWTNIGTNYPVNGLFSSTNIVTMKTSPQFYRSILLQ